MLAYVNMLRLGETMFLTLKHIINNIKILWYVYLKIDIKDGGYIYIKIYHIILYE